VRPSTSWLLPLGLLLLLGLAAAAAPWLAPYDPALPSGTPLLAPDATHLLGTNDVGQDLLSEWLWAGRTSLAVALGATALATLLAWSVGLASGFVRGLDAPLTSVCDLLVAIPILPLCLLVLPLVGPSALHVGLLLGLLAWPVFARLVRARVREARSAPFVEAARAVGASPARLALLHVLPATLGLLPTELLVTTRLAVFGEATLAFLGAGDGSVRSWGATLGRAFADPLLFARPVWPWWVLPPAVAILVLVVSVTWVGLLLALPPASEQAREPLIEQPHRAPGRPSRARRQVLSEIQVLGR
jgi:ABC-type dipeptide/oligopeptide/nickel transport system permease subunit